MKDKFELTPELMKKRRDKKAAKEQLLFLALCSERDRKLIRGEEEMTIQDFDRIGYLIEALGFDCFGWNFAFGHEELLSELGTRIKQEVEVPGKLNLPKTMETVKRWSGDFCDELPSDEMKTYMKRLFYLE